MNIYLKKILEDKIGEKPFLSDFKRLKDSKILIDKISKLKRIRLPK